MDALELGPPVVISPSLSGMYSLPFLTAPGSQLRGYVPVAPICTDKINAADYASVKVSLCARLRSPSQGLSSCGGQVAKGWLLGGAEPLNTAFLVFLAYYCAKPCAKQCTRTDRNPCPGPRELAPSTPLGQLISPPHLEYSQGKTEVMGRPGADL